MIAFLRSLPPRRRTATLLGWGLLIASPFLLLAAISLVTGHNAFATYPVWSDELDYWRNLFTWDAVGFHTGYNGLLEEFARVGTLGAHGFTAVMLYGWFVKLFGLGYHTIVLANAVWVSLGAAAYCGLMRPRPARAALLAVRSVSKKPVIVSFTCDEHGRTLTGTDPAAALVVLQGMGADAFGLNCSVGPAELLEQIKRLRPWAEVPLLAKPNAGLPETVDGRTVYNCPPEEFAALAAEFAAAGVGFIGGCCGTDERHIAALRAALEGVKTAAPAPDYGGMLPAATEMDAFLLDPAAEPPEPLECGEDLAESIADALDEGAETLCVAVNSLEEAELFADAQYAVRAPLFIESSDPAALEAALRAYQGRAIYSGPLADDVLVPLAEKYGLII